MLICDDPDAPGGTFVHWVYYNIPAAANSLPEAVANDPQPAPGGLDKQKLLKAIDGHVIAEAQLMGTYSR